MNIDTLKRIIKESVKDTPSDNKTLTVTGELLESSSITNLFANYLTNEPLTLTIDEPLSETDESITISGTSTHVLFSQMAIVAEFRVIESEAALFLTAHPIEGWDFTSSFPSLATTFFSRLSFQSESALYLTSHPTIENAAVGLFFTGLLQMNGMLSFFSWLLGGATELVISGAIHLQAGYPILQLATEPSTDTLELGFLQLPIPQFELTSYVKQDEVNESFNFSAVATIHSSINVETSSGMISIPLRADSYLNSPWIQLSTKLDNALQASFDHLSSLANGMDLESIVPQQLPIQNQIGLSGVVLQVDLAKRKLESVLIGVESKQVWQLIEDVIAIEKLQLFFRLIDPIGTKKLSMTLSGEFGIG